MSITTVTGLITTVRTRLFAARCALAGCDQQTRLNDSEDLGYGAFCCEQHWAAAQ